MTAVGRAGAAGMERLSAALSAMADELERGAEALAIKVRANLDLDMRGTFVAGKPTKETRAVASQHLLNAQLKLLDLVAAAREVFGAESRLAREAERGVNYLHHAETGLKKKLPLARPEVAEAQITVGAMLHDTRETQRLVSDATGSLLQAEPVGESLRRSRQRLEEMYDAGGAWGEARTMLARDIDRAAALEPPHWMDLPRVPDELSSTWGAGASGLRVKLLTDWSTELAPLRDASSAAQGFSDSLGKAGTAHVA